MIWVYLTAGLLFFLKMLILPEPATASAELAVLRSV